jgi:hypothetical protein
MTTTSTTAAQQPAARSPAKIEVRQSKRSLISVLEDRIKDLRYQLQVAQDAAEEWRDKAYAARDDVVHWRDLYGRSR